MAISPPEPVARALEILGPEDDAISVGRVQHDWFTPLAPVVLVG